MPWQHRGSDVRSGRTRRRRSSCRGRSVSLAGFADRTAFVGSVVRLAAVTLALLSFVSGTAAAQEPRVFMLLGGPSARYALADGAPATSVNLQPVDIAVAPDGSVLVLAATALYRIDPGGRIGRVAGGGAQGPSGDGGPARDASLQGANDVAVAPDGSILIGDGCAVRRISTDGVIRRVADHVRPLR